MAGAKITGRILETAPAFTPSGSLYGQLSGSQSAKIASYCEAMREWNSQINLVSRKDIDHFEERHVLFSLAISRYVRFSNGSKVLDAGSGGGLPGIPLAIVFPETYFFLVDSKKKKMAVVDRIIDHLGLANVETCSQRVESIDGKQGAFDFVVSRGVGQVPTVWKWTHRLISRSQRHDISNGLLYLKGGDGSGEPANSDFECSEVQVSDYFKSPYFKSKLLVHCSHKGI